MAAGKKAGLSDKETQDAKDADLKPEEYKGFADAKKNNPNLTAKEYRKRVTPDEMAAGKKAGLSDKETQEAKDAGLKPDEYKSFADAKKKNPKLTAEEHRRKLDDDAAKRKAAKDGAKGRGGPAAIFGSMGGALASLLGALAGTAGRLAELAAQAALAAMQAAAAVVEALAGVLGSLLQDLFGSMSNMVPELAPVDATGKPQTCEDRCKILLVDDKLSDQDKTARKKAIQTIILNVMNQFGKAQVSQIDALDPNTRAQLCKSITKRTTCSDNEIKAGVNALSNYSGATFYTFLTTFITLQYTCDKITKNGLPCETTDVVAASASAKN